MSQDTYNPDYVLHSDEEPLRLERQARIYGPDDDLRHLQPGSARSILDAGCGSGWAARMIAKAAPSASVVGVDREPRYVDFARRKAASEGLTKVRFEVGDLTSLPFADGEFELVWSKHVLQWVAARSQALAEMVRVTRPGGRIVCANFDGFCLEHFPQDAQVQADMARFMSAAGVAFGFDPYLGRKLPALFRDAGLVNVRWDFMPDRAFCGFGGDPERRWNWEQQFRSAHPFTAQVFGGDAAALAVAERVVARFNDPQTFVHCAMYYVQGEKPR